MSAPTFTLTSVVHNQVVNPAGHVAAAGLLTGAWINMLTPSMTFLATVLAALWYAVTLYESKTMQSFIIRFRAHFARVLKNRGHKKSGQKIAEKALEDAKHVVEVARVEVADAKDTVADVQTAVDKK